MCGLIYKHIFAFSNEQTLFSFLFSVSILTNKLPAFNSMYSKKKQREKSIIEFITSLTKKVTQ